MMLIKTRLGRSRIEGIGVFASEPIAKDTVLWKFVPGFDQKFTSQQIAALPKNAREYIATYAYLSKKSGFYILCMDQGKYFNHSKAPNTSNLYANDEEEVVTRALRNIRRGEEITADYGDFEKKASFFSPKAFVKECRIGKGIFVKEKVLKGEVVLDFSTGPGKYLPPLEAARYEQAGNHFIIQVDDELYLVATEGPEPVDFVNHSCDPSCGIRGTVTVVAMRDIEPEEEVTFDYMMTESWPWYKMDCACGTARCRGAVTGRDWKDEALQKKYAGYFSSYIDKKIKRHPVHKFILRKQESLYWRVKRWVRNFRNLFSQ